MSRAPHTLNTQTAGMAHDVRAVSPDIPTTASMAAIRSPYAAGIAKTGESDDPRNQKAESNEPKCVRNQQRDQSILPTHGRESGKMYSFVTVPKATKLISTLSPNNAMLSIDRLAVSVQEPFLGNGWRESSRRRAASVEAQSTAEPLNDTADKPHQTSAQGSAPRAGPPRDASSRVEAQAGRCPTRC